MSVENIGFKDKFDQIKQLFSKFSASYDQHMTDTNHYSAQEVVIGKLIENLSFPMSDLCCGTGSVSKIILGQSTTSRAQKIHLVDFSESMIESAKASTSNYPNLEFHVQDVHDLNFLKNREIKSISMAFSFSWFKDTSKVIREILKILNHGDTLFIMEEIYFDGFVPTPIFSEKGDYLSHLASLESFASADHIKAEILSTNNFELVASAECPIDKKHKLIGMVFKVIA